MKTLKIFLAVSVSLPSAIASASLVVTNNGFIDTSNNLEWLAPNKVTSLSDYNTYAEAGWQVAKNSDLDQLTANFFTYDLHYSAYDRSVFDGFKAIADTNHTSDYNFVCNGTFFCSEGWYHNVATDGRDVQYEFGFIGLFSNPAQTDPYIVQQNKLDTASAFINTTLGSYPLYGYSNGSYDTFMIRAVPLPGAAWLFGSGLVALVGATRKHKST